uniref:Uncharacterized protein n=1 Tax=Ciona savignyi TaxID=51511 RepID=H2ZJJ8_CIOSA
MMKTLLCRNVEKDSMADVLQPFVKRSVVEDVFSSKALDALLDNEVDSLEKSSSISRLADAQFDTSKIKYVTPASQSGYTKTLESVLKRKNQTTEIISLPENSYKGTLKRKLSKEINKKGSYPSLKRTFNLPKVRKCLDKQHNTQTFKQHKNYQDEYKRHSHEEKANRLNISPKIQLKTNNSLKKVNKILQKQSGSGSDKHTGTTLFHQKAKSIPQKMKCQEQFIQPVTATQAQFSLSALHILSRWNQLIKDNSSISTVSTDKDSLGLPDFSQQVLGFRHLRKRKQLSLAETPVQKIHTTATSSLRKPVVGIIKDLVKPIKWKICNHHFERISRTFSRCCRRYCK